MKKKMYLILMSICLAAAAVPAAVHAEAEEAAETEAAAEETAEAAEETAEAAEETAEAAEETTEAAEDAAADEAPEFTGIPRLVSVDDLSQYIKLGEYKGIEVTPSTEAITPEDVDERIQSELASFEEEVTDGVVQNGDTAVINYVGTKDGVAFDGGTANGYYLEIGSGTFIDGFEEGLIGMAPGETKDLNLTFPENYGNADLAGQAVVFQVTVEQILRAPELTDEWVAENIEECEDIAAYRQYIQAQLEEEEKEYAEQMMMSDAWAQVYENTEFLQYPEDEMNRYKEQIDEQYTSYAAQGGMELEAFVESQGMTMDQYEEQKEQYAEYMTGQCMLIQAILDAENVDLSGDEIKGYADQLAQAYGVQQVGDLILYFGEEPVYQTIGLMWVENFIVNNAKVTEEAAPAEEAPAEETAETEAAAEETAEVEEAAEETAETEAAAE